MPAPEVTRAEGFFMTVKVKLRACGTVCMFSNVEYIRRVDEKRKVRTMHFYEIKRFDAPFPAKHGTSDFDILEVTQ